MQPNQVVERLTKRLRTHGAVPIELAVAVIVAAVLRVYRIGDESIWLDEAVSIGVARDESWWFLLFEFPGMDPHPPLHYLLTKAWIGVFGASEFSVRLQSALLGVATVPVLYYLGIRLFDRFTAATASIFFAVAPFQVWYGQEARMYALFVFLTVASFLALVHLTERYTTRRVAVYVVVAALLAYTHVYALFILFVQGVFVVWRWFRASDPGEAPLSLSFDEWLRTYVALGAAISPWLLLMLVRLTESTGRIAWISEPEPAVFRRIFTLFSFGYTSDAMYYHPSPPTLLLIVAAGCVVLALGLLVPGTSLRPSTETAGWGLLGRSSKHERAAIQLLTLWLVVPIALAYSLSHLVTPFLILRPMTAISPAFLLLMAVGARALASVSIPYRSAVPYAVAVILISGMLVPLPAFYDTDHKEQWRDAATFIDRTAEPGDVVLISHPYNDRPFFYYFENDDVKVIGVWPDDDLTELDESLDDASQVYVVLRGVWGEDRQRLLDQTDAAIDGNHFGAEHRQYVGVDVYRFILMEDD